jgi:hypothetical protein
MRRVLHRFHPQRREMLLEPRLSPVCGGWTLPARGPLSFPRLPQAPLPFSTSDRYFRLVSLTLVGVAQSEIMTYDGVLHY